MHSLDLILTLAGGLGAALVFGFATHRAGLSPIVGYLVAGLLVGPYTPGFVADRHMAEQLAEVGIILLMFGVGMQFHVEELVAVWRVAVPGAIAQSAVATGLGLAVAHAFGWTGTAGLVFGIGLSVASTVVLIRVLSDNRDLHTPAGHIAVGWLVVEDLLTVLVLVMMPAIFARGAESSSLTVSLALALVKVAVLTALILVAGRRVVPWLLTKIAATRSRELFTLDRPRPRARHLGRLGTVLRRVDGARRVSRRPRRRTVGVQRPRGVRGVADARCVRGALLRLGRHAARSRLRDECAAPHPVGAGGRAHRQAARGVGARPPVGLPGGRGASDRRRPGADRRVLVHRRGRRRTARARHRRCEEHAHRDGDGVHRRQPAPLPGGRAARAVGAAATVSGRETLAGWPIAPSAADRDPRHRAVIIGYGPVGRTVARLLRQNDVTPTIVDLNIDTVRALRDEGLPAIYGDAGHRDTLVSAGVPTAGAIILSVAGLAAAKEVITMARELNPSILILARTAYIRELVTLKQAGATVVYSGEGEVALAFTETILGRLGATPEQIDRERARVHEEILAPQAS